MLRVSAVRPVRRRKAASMVELAIVVSLFFAVILAITEIGRAMMVVSLLNNSASSGCRLGVLEWKSTQEITDSVQTDLTNRNVKGATVTVLVNNQVADAST